MKFFGLKHKEFGTIARISVESNGDAEFCNSVRHSLSVVSSDDDMWGDSLWLVKSRDVAERASMADAAWYNASYTTPENDHAGEWEVVEIVISVVK